jgi:hypothetical protein
MGAVLETAAVLTKAAATTEKVVEVNRLPFR